MRQLHSATFTVPAIPESVGTARHHARETLASWQTAVDPDIAELLLSETVTNAIVHGTSGQQGNASVLIDLIETPIGLQCQVHDTDQHDLDPEHGDPLALSESGRGLDLVEALSEHWGVKQEPGGKFVYFLLPYTATSWPSSEMKQAVPAAMHSATITDSRTAGERRGRRTTLAMRLCSPDGRAPQPSSCMPTVGSPVVDVTRLAASFRARLTPSATRFGVPGERTRRIQGFEIRDGITTETHAALDSGEEIKANSAVCGECGVTGAPEWASRATRQVLLEPGVVHPQTTTAHRRCEWVALRYASWPVRAEGVSAAATVVRIELRDPETDPWRTVHDSASALDAVAQVARLRAPGRAGMPGEGSPR